MSTDRFEWLRRVLNPRDDGDDLVTQYLYTRKGYTYATDRVRLFWTPTPGRAEGFEVPKINLRASYPNLTPYVDQPRDGSPALLEPGYLAGLPNFITRDGRIAATLAEGVSVDLQYLTSTLADTGPTLIWWRGGDRPIVHGMTVGCGDWLMMGLRP